MGQNLQSIYHPDAPTFQHHVLPQTIHIFSEDNVSVIENILRFENLQNDLNLFLEKCGLNHISLSHDNFSGKEGKGKSSNIPYTDFYTEKWMVDMIGEIYYEDVEFGNYEFGEGS